ncbi:hypothetical protein ARMSODRAFT_1021397 [Armillaria solidipes]|uniref:Retrotransposon gag domain-containing protein n=1 Tax=Armillaria solidipes TaxID=1076256 RepID=A0A2H3BRV5_9AGAR|nr:hypothetical protein ARMSODRAFT_1021397 [Armillaria solidipes]
MLQPSKPFKGEHDDIERFLGDCITYFKAFTSYFLLPSQMVPFAASHFKGPAKDWWVYKRQEFWMNSDWDIEPTQFRYLDWEEFTALVNAQFRDPVVEEVHEKKMFDLQIGNGSATAYFQKLEKEAKEARL